MKKEKRGMIREAPIWSKWSRSSPGWRKPSSPCSWPAWEPVGPRAPAQRRRERSHPSTRLTNPLLLLALTKSHDLLLTWKCPFPYMLPSRGFVLATGEKTVLEGAHTSGGGACLWLAVTGDDTSKSHQESGSPAAPRRSVEMPRWHGASPL